MFAERWFYDFVIYTYALSLIFSFSDLLHSSLKARRIAYGLLVLVWTAETAIVAVHVLRIIPLAAVLDSFLIYSWLLISFALALERLQRMPLFFFAASLAGFAVLALHFFFARDVTPELARLMLSELVLVHVTLAVAAYAAFTLSSISAGLCLLNIRLLKRKKWTVLLRRLPSQDRLQQFGKWLLMAGVLLLLIAVMLGILYAYQTVGHMFWTDPKILGSLTVFLAYGFVLFQQVTGKWQAKRQAWWNVWAFVSILLNYVISRSGFSFHHWI